MAILLIFYAIFIIVYMAFNAYIIFRVISIRIKNDYTNRGIIVYMIAIAVILLVSFIFISSLNWRVNLIGGKLGI